MTNRIINKCINQGNNFTNHQKNINMYLLNIWIKIDLLIKNNEFNIKKIKNINIIQQQRNDILIINTHMLNLKYMIVKIEIR